MEVTGLGVDAASEATVLLLEGEGESLGMVIGLAEATSIAKALDQLELKRPMAHDLLQDVMNAVGANLCQIEVVDLRDATYYAELIIEDAAGVIHRIDSRPSDAIALALRAGAPILVHEHVLGNEAPAAKEFPSPADKEGWKKILEEMEPESFGKYKM
jgi:bifunctional DNase/RNase